MNIPFYRTSDFLKANDIYQSFRIPGMIVTDKGTLLTYCEARKYDNRGISDWVMMDIVLRRSVDHGENFEDPIILAAGDEKHNAVNNPVMVQDKNGRIHFLYCEDYSINAGRVLRRFSDDDGLTWSDPIDITESTMPHYRNAFALGPGHGILTKDNVIIIPIWMVPKHYESDIKAHTPSVLSTIYSMDNGETWKMGDIIHTNKDVISPNESEVALTSDGRIYLNARHQAYYRAKAYSKTGYSNWTDYGPEYKLSDPQCFGSVVAYNDNKHPYALIYAGCASKTLRKNVSVFASVDDGKTFPISRIIDKERGGYCELAVDSKSKLIYLLYEDNFGITNHLVTFNYEWLFDNYNY